MADTGNAINEGDISVPENPAAQAVPRRARSRRRNRCLVPVACVTAFVLLMNAGISLLLMQWQAPVTVSFDMAGTVNNFMSQVAGQHLDDAQVKATTARFNRALNAALTGYIREHHAVILVGPAVVGGAEDITGAVQQQVAGEMAGQ